MGLYIPAGKFVCELNENKFGGGEIRWNEENNRGSMIVPGLYVCV